MTEDRKRGKRKFDAAFATTLVIAMSVAGGGGFAARAWEAAQAKTAAQAAAKAAQAEPAAPEASAEPVIPAAPAPDEQQQAPQAQAQPLQPQQFGTRHRRFGSGIRFFQEAPQGGVTTSPSTPPLGTSGPS